MTFEEFKEFYKKFGRCPNDIGKRKNPLNERQLVSRYDKYLKSLQKKKDALNRQSVDEEWDFLKKEVSERDKGSCRLVSFLQAENSFEIIEELKHNAGHLFYIIDHAHIIRRSVSPKLKYNPKNVILLNRYSHGNLDQYRHPITGSSIAAEEVENWWIFLVGENNYKELKEQVING